MKFTHQTYPVSVVALILFMATVSFAGAPGDAIPASPGTDDIAPEATANDSHAPDDSFAGIAGFHAEYEASYIGFSAEATVDLKPTENTNEYAYEVVTRARGLARLVRSGTGREKSRFVYNASGFWPARYQLDDGTEKVENDTDIVFDWEEGVAHSNYKGVPKDIAITPGMLDRLTADITTIHALRNGREPGSPELVDRNSIRVYEYTFQGKETVSVPAGEFRTVKYLRQRPGSSRATMIWYAPDVAYLPVKIENLKRGKSNVVMVATLLEPAPCEGCDTP
jgi:hypothetical protein